MNNAKKTYCVGVDIGSTTMKIAVMDDTNALIFSDYKRHHADIRQTAISVLDDLYTAIGDCRLKIVITGSVGMGYAQRLGFSFVQEVVAAAEMVKQRYPEVGTFIDMGGEDSKMIFFEKGKVPDIRMNGSCAGGTGAFIDQTATLLNVETRELNDLAAQSQTIYPIASRCGVFSKTDIQNLISRNISRADIAASVFNAVAMQVVASLSRGMDITPTVFFCGGPFAFLPELQKHFRNVLGLNESQCLLPENAQIIPASGCALIAKKQSNGEVEMTDIIKIVKKSQNTNPHDFSNRLEALFSNKDEYDRWISNKNLYYVPRAELQSDIPTPYFMGIDSGSTTTKLILLNSRSQVVYTDYQRNNGDSFRTFHNMLKKLFDSAKNPQNVIISGSCVTGYGENLIKTAFNIDYGIVETMAHFSAAKQVEPHVSFVLDIGGQDMKAIFVDNGSIRRMEINEACSSGCGSFIETFANMMNYPVAEFAQISCFAQHPCDLGTRCTVFMNSKVKQAMQEGAAVEDIAAGFSFSVVKNCLFKVLKIKNIDELGKNIVVQGGTFRNHSIVRALEKMTGCNVSFSDIPELMGAYGAALYARNCGNNAQNTATTLNNLVAANSYDSEFQTCPGCENHCSVKLFHFQNGNTFFSGNNCEKVFSNANEVANKGINMFAEKYALLFKKNEITIDKNALTIGIPRGLGIYEDYPFWQTLLNSCGFKVVLSNPSNNKQYESGLRSIMADNICFPAKLMHGHINDLIAKKVDRILYPYVVYERKEDAKSRNSYNCPIVAGYSDVIKSSMDPAIKAGIPMDAPAIAFNNEKLLYKSCETYLQSLGIEKSKADEAIAKALIAQDNYLKNLTQRANEILDAAMQENRMVILLAGRPYHIDPMIEHKISHAIAEMGIDVITENVATISGADVYDELNAVSQWGYPNRIFKAAYFVGRHAYHNLHFVELTSFGCGPDSFILDEVNAILRRFKKNHTILKIDDVNNIGSLRLRVRSLVESVKNAEKNNDKADSPVPYITTRTFTKAERHRTLIGPYFAEGYSEFFPSIFKIAGYKLITLPTGNQQAVETGLKFANNEVCYPATLVVGSIMNALLSGDYNPNDVAVIMTQTGGQCRASNYYALIKNALVSAGFEDVPVISLALSASVTATQPGFTIPWKKILSVTVNTVLYADCLAKLYHAAVVREKVPGSVKALREKYIQSALPIIEANNGKGLQKLLASAVNEFTAAIDTTKNVPVIGVVGEIYVKYNGFSNKFVVNWLEEHGVEVVPPAFIGFLTTGFANNHINRQLNIKDVKFPQWLNDFVYNRLSKLMCKYNEICSSFPFYRPLTSIFDDAKLAERVVNMAGDFGEGWFLPGEICHLAENGIHNVVSLQPFGCIANHIISKGVEKKLKQIYPQLSLLFLDFDSGTSEANVFNRLHFMVENCKSAESDAAKIIKLND